MKEIGSEYWLSPNSLPKKEDDSFTDLISFGEDRRLLFTGRTAIDFVLEDIDREINNVYMPSYCCDSMLQPFIERNIQIDFYEVELNDKTIKYNIDYNKKTDIFFASSYFGYSSTNMDKIINEFNSKRVIIIEDITHRLLSDCCNHCETADYSIASLRKWFAIPSGGLAVKHCGPFKDIELLEPPKQLIEIKVAAMRKKASYMYGESFNDEQSKSDFLRLFSEFNRMIPLHYKKYKIDSKSKEILKKIDIALIRRKRKENVEFFYNNYRETEHIKFLFNKPNKHDCLLFVPLYVRKSIREELRKYLISNSIFCPIHWPVPEKVLLQKSNIEIYNNELSLICDQRYDVSDMKNIVLTLGEFAK